VSNTSIFQPASVPPKLKPKKLIVLAKSMKISKGFPSKPVLREFIPRVLKLPINALLMSNGTPLADVKVTGPNVIVTYCPRVVESKSINVPVARRGSKDVPPVPERKMACTAFCTLRTMSNRMLESILEVVTVVSEEKVYSSGNESVWIVVSSRTM
jgi:hypothetical protein